MNGRNKNRGAKRIPTVSAARKVAKRRMKKDELDKLVLRLKVIGDSALDIDRSCIAHNITKNIPEFGLSSKRRNSAHRFRALRWLVKEAVRLIRLEKDQSVLFWLIRLVSECFGYRTRNFAEYKDEAIVMRLAIFVLKQEAEILARICHRILVDFRARNGKFPGKPLKNAFLYVMYNEWEDAEVPLTLSVLSNLLRLRGEEGDLRDFMHELGRDKHVMGLLFEAVTTESHTEVRERNDADECIALLLRFSRSVDRAFLMGEYGAELKRTFMGMDTYLLGEYNALHKHNVAEFFVNDAELLEMMYGRMTRGCIGDRDEIFILAARLLKCGLQIGDDMLQRMLGMGFLFSAHHMARLDYDGDRQEADTYRAVLAAHPEWKQKFRVMTDVENGTSHTAQLGKTIPARTSKRAQYVMEEDVDDI